MNENERSRIVNGLKLPPKRVIKLPPKKAVSVKSNPKDGARTVGILPKGPKEWIYHSQETDSNVGPLSAHDLVEVITPETFVWKEGMQDWAKAGDVQEMASAVWPLIKPKFPPLVISEG